MKFNNSHDLNEYVSKMANGVCVLSFSAGKDSVASWLILRRYFTRIIPFYLDPLPGLSIHADILEYYEDYFKTHIIRLPHPNFYRMLRYNLYQAPERLHIRDKFEDMFPEFSLDDVHNIIFEDMGLDKNVLVAIGVTQNDSMVRRVAMKTHGALNMNRRTFYPIFDYTREQLKQELRDAEIKLGRAYKLFGRSFDGIGRLYSKPLKEHVPEDYQCLLDWFPLAEADILRHQWREEYWSDKK